MITLQQSKKYISGVQHEGGCVSLTFLGILVSFLYLILVLSEACGGSKILEDTLSENYLSSSLKIQPWCWATKLFSVIPLMLQMKKRMELTSSELWANHLLKSTIKEPRPAKKRGGEKLKKKIPKAYTKWNWCKLTSLYLETHTKQKPPQSIKQSQRRQGLKL